MYYYLLYNSSFSFIVENRLFSTILYGSILYILTHAILNYCDVSLLTIINNYFWTIFSLDIISFSYALYNSYINNTGVSCNNSNNINNSSGDSNNMNVSFNLLKNKINTMFDRKNDLTITQIPQNKKSSSNSGGGGNGNNTNTHLQENFSNININTNNNNVQKHNDDFDFSDLDNIGNIGIQDTSTQYSTPISHLKGNKKIQDNLQQSTPINIKNNSNRHGTASTPISIIRNNIKIEDPIIQDDNDIQYNGGGGESVAGSDVGSIMDLEDFEKSF